MGFYSLVVKRDEIWIYSGAKVVLQQRLEIIYFKSSLWHLFAEHLDLGNISIKLPFLEFQKHNNFNILRKLQQVVLFHHTHITKHNHQINSPIIKHQGLDIIVGVADGRKGEQPAVALLIELILQIGDVGIVCDPYVVLGFVDNRHLMQGFEGD